MMTPILLVAALVGVASAAPSDPAAFARASLGLARFKVAEVDLDGRGGTEALVLSADPGRCGSAGCTLYMLARTKATWRVVSTSTVTRAPIRVLVTSSAGWRDIGVRVGGGGMAPGSVRLRFDGRRYPANPTMLSVEPIAREAGRVVIAP